MLLEETIDFVVIFPNVIERYCSALLRLFKESLDRFLVLLDFFHGILRGNTDD